MEPLRIKIDRYNSGDRAMEIIDTRITTIDGKSHYSASEARLFVHGVIDCENSNENITGEFMGKKFKAVPFEWVRNYSPKGFGVELDISYDVYFERDGEQQC